MPEEHTKKSFFEISESVVYATLEMAIIPVLISTFLLCLQIAVVIYYKNMNIISIFHAITYFAAQICCSLLVYDKKLFKILFEETPQTDIFDKTLNLLWNKKIIPNRSIKSRLKGSGRIIKTAFCLIFIQLILVVLYLLQMN